MKDKYKFIKPDNGLTLVLQKMSNTRSVSICLGVKAGSRYEANETYGVAHFLEHMLFEGTKKFPTSKKLAEFIERAGANSSAYTDREYVIYNIKVLDKDIERAFKYLSEIVFNSLLDSPAIEKEKSIVIEEIKRAMDNPEVMIWEEWMRRVWGNDQPLGRSVLGNEQNIGNITQLKLRKYLDDFYKPSNMVISTIGNFSFKHAEGYIRKYFGREDRGKLPISQKTKVLPKKRQIEILQKDTQQVQLLCGFPTKVSYSHPDRFVMRLLSNILSGGVSARLFHKLVYELGIAYSTGTTSFEFADVGTFFVSGGFAEKNIVRALIVVLEELKRLQEEEMLIEELKNVKRRSIAQMHFSLENSDSLANLYTTQLITEGKITTPEEMSQKIEMISPRDIKRVAQESFKIDNFFVLLCGPVKREKRNIIEEIFHKESVKNFATFRV